MGFYLLIIYLIIYQSSAPLLHSGAGYSLILTQLRPGVKGTKRGGLLLFDTFLYTTSCISTASAV